MQTDLSSTRWPPVLMYHSIADLAHDPNMICTSPDLFARQMRYLKRRGLRGVSVSEMLRKLKAGEDPRKLVGLTFDDGYKDFLGAAVPTLVRHGFSATVFVVADRSENDWKHAFSPRPHLEILDSEELHEVRESGMEVGAHSMTHPNLSEIDSERAFREIAESRNVLSERLGEEIEGFCYPYGGLNEAAVLSVKKSGFAYGCAWNTHTERGIYDLPRIPISNKDSLLRFASKLKLYPSYVRAKKLLT